MPTAGGCWVNMRGSLWRCSNEQLRPATNDENLGAELVNRYLGDLRWDFQRNRGAKKYVDVRAEGIPAFPGEADENEEMPDLSDNSDEEDDEPEAPPSDAVSPQPQSEPSLPASAPDTPILGPQPRPSALVTRQREGREPQDAPLRDRSRSPSASDTPARGNSERVTAQPGTPVGGERPPVFPYPFSSVVRPNATYSANHYVEFSAERKEGGGELQNSSESFLLQKQLLNLNQASITSLSRKSLKMQR